MVEQHLDIPTPDGTIDAILVRPDGTTPFPGVILLTDIFGNRPGNTDVASQIAKHGYVVLTPNIFFRTARPPVFDLESDFSDERTMAKLRALTSPLTPDVMERDGSAYVDFLAAQPGVRHSPMGVVGFCFAGQFAMRVAAARPDKIGAAASFHGGGLVNDTEHSPHLLLPRIKANLYFGHAENDRGMPAEAIEKLNGALHAWGGKYGSEVYTGAGHGWMMPDRAIYNPPQAQRGLDNLIALFDNALQHAPATA